MLAVPKYCPLLLLFALALSRPLPMLALGEALIDGAITSLDEATIDEPARQILPPDMPKDFSIERESTDLKSQTRARGEAIEKKNKDGIAGRMKLSDNKKTTGTSPNKASKLKKDTVTSGGKKRKEPRRKNKGDSDDSSTSSDDMVRKKEREEKDPKDRDIKICDEKNRESKKGWRQQVEGELQDYVSNCVKNGNSRPRYSSSDPPSFQPSSSSVPSAPTQAPVSEPSMNPTVAPSTPTFAPTMTVESDRLSSDGEAPTVFPHMFTPSPVDSPTSSPVPTSANIAVGAPRYDGGVLMPVASPSPSQSDFPSEQPSAAVTLTPTEPAKETLQPTGIDERAVTVPVSFFSISYETSGIDPTTEEFMEAESITLEFLSQFMADTFEATASVAFEVLYGFATERTLNPTRIGFEATVGFRGLTDYTPTSSDLDMLIRIAFGESSSDTLLEQLSTLPSTNPFSTTSSVTYTLDSDLSTAREEGGGGAVSTVVVVGGLAGLITLLLLTAMTIVVRKRAREGRLRPKSNERHELMPGGSYDESLYSAPANVLEFPFESTEKRSLTDSDLSYEAEMRRVYGSQYPSSLEGSL